MLRYGSLAAALLLQGVVAPLTAEPDLLRYAITQGGLLAVVLVLLWFIRLESRRKDDRLAVLTQLVANTTAALTRNTEQGDRLARAVENLERRGHTR